MTLARAPSYYTALITAPHSDAPKFIATVAASIEPLTVLQALAESIQTTAFALGTAVGKQLDTVGITYGYPRSSGLYVDPGLPSGGGAAYLSDAQFAAALGVHAAAGVSNGSENGLFNALQIVFNGAGLSGSVGVVDHNDMSIDVIFNGTALADPNVASAFAVTRAAQLAPVGVQIKSAWYNNTGSPIFAWNVTNNLAFAGWAVGAWGAHVNS